MRGAMDMERMQLRILICQWLVARDYPDLDVTLAARYQEPWIAQYVNQMRAQIMASQDGRKNFLSVKLQS